jgi:acetylornithine/succinyldiaminopimelate/putrescine aminotransferase
MLHPNLANTSPYPYTVEVSYADGIFVYDKSGRAYYDFISGISVSNIGHRHPRVISAIQNQIAKHLHVMVYGEFFQDAQVNLAVKLNEILPNTLNCTYFVNSGTEAIEAALKLAKRITGRTKIVSCKGAYHGNTHGSMSVSWNEYKKAKFRPLLPDVYFMEFNDLQAISLIDERTACVIMEPIQGDAGVRIPSMNYMKEVRKRCDEVGAVLIYDEIQTGFGRTGKMFAFEHFDVVPDILAIAKGLGGGMPIGAFISSQENMALLTHNPPLGHITTFGGHPVNCAAALANIEVLQTPGLIDDVERKGALIEQLLSKKHIVEIRRKGLFFAIEMSDADKVQRVVNGCKEAGLLSFWFLSCPESFRIAPPLIVTDVEIKAAVAIINQVIEAL